MLWSPSSKTALAEAEISYKDDHVSQSVFVKFPIVRVGAGLKTLIQQHDIDITRLHLVVWTTTPWTLPANMVNLACDRGILLQSMLKYLYDGRNSSLPTLPPSNTQSSVRPIRASIGSLPPEGWTTSQRRLAKTWRRSALFQVRTFRE